MKLAIIGSRNLTGISIDEYIFDGVTEIVSGGAKGIDTKAKDFAIRKGLKIVEFLPDYNLYGNAAPLKRNEKIARYADAAIALWDGKSKGTEHTIKMFNKLGKKVTVIILKENQ